MNFTEFLQEIKSLMLSKVEEAKVPVVPEKKDYTLSDGTVIRTDKLETGASVTIVLPDGTEKPLPIGDYIMDDGTTIKVTKEGIIDTVEQKAETVVTDTLPTEMSKVEPIKEDFSEIFEGFKSISTKYDELSKVNLELKVELEALKTRLDIVEKQPATEKKKFNKTEDKTDPNAGWKLLQEINKHK